MPHQSQPSQPFPTRSGTELFGIFYGASWGLGLALGATVYATSYFSGNDHASTVSFSTKTGMAGSGFITVVTPLIFAVMAPIKNISTEYKKRAVCAFLGASLGLAQSGLVTYFSQFTREQPEEKIEFQIAPPVRAELKPVNDLA